MKRLKPAQQLTDDANNRGIWSDIVLSREDTLEDLRLVVKDSDDHTHVLERTQIEDPSHAVRHSILDSHIVDDSSMARKQSHKVSSKQFLNSSSEGWKAGDHESVIVAHLGLEDIVLREDSKTRQVDSIRILLRANDYEI